MKTSTKLIILIVFTAITFSSCKKEDTAGQASELTRKINRFIKDVMEEVYLWNEELPNIDGRYELDSKEYFEKLLYKEDKWSYLTDDVQALENSFKGKEKTFGWSLAFGKLSGSETIVALVEFIYPNSPAEEAGIKRGDMIFKINNANITADNYSDLLYADNLNCSYGQYNSENKVIENTKTIQLSSENLDLDPVQFSKIIEESGHKIGYFLYTQFIDEYTSSLDTLFKNFINEGVSDVILDLRYNPGGSLYSAQYLCSALAPLESVSNEDVLVTLQWNHTLQFEYEQNAIMKYLEKRLINSVPFKMGLERVYILTGYGTASASELTISGLMPYMDVITVGDTTFGKYTASQTYKPEDVYGDENYYKDFNNWGIQPIVAKYRNSEGFTDFLYGLYPTILVHDQLTKNIPVGSTDDPVLKAAIEDITGTSILATKSATKRPYKIFDRGFSRFDANKRELSITRTISKSEIE